MEAQTQKEVLTKPEKKMKYAAPVRRTTTFSNPFMAREISLNTTPAQMVFEISYDDSALAMRSLSSVLPTLVKNGSEMMAVNGAVDHLLNNTMAEIRKEEARIQKIAEDNGISLDKLSYTHVVKHKATLTCGKAGQYLQMIVEMDALLCSVHSAWFAGFIQDDAKAALERQWRRKVTGVATEIKSITNRAFRAAEKPATSVATSEGGDAVNADGGADNATAIAKPEKTKRAKKSVDTPVTQTDNAAEVAVV